MNGFTSVSNSGKTYEVVTCESGRCSFQDTDCSTVCNCPTWWLEIHGDGTMGLREYSKEEMNLITPGATCHDCPRKTQPIDAIV